MRLAAPLSGPRKNQGSGWAGRAAAAKCPPALALFFRGLRCTTGRARGGWRGTAGRALGEEIASPLVLEPDLSCHDMWGGLGDAETTRGRRLVLDIQGCPGNASPKPKSGPLALAFSLFAVSSDFGLRFVVCGPPSVSKSVICIYSAFSIWHLAFGFSWSLGRTWWSEARGADRPLAYGVVFLRLSGGLGCFSPAIDTYID